ncbi:TPA: O20/O137 family O-antigen flippase, partial [Escherichia coli]|nr:O20/O137 family O-antigen flippase [Escherichia coli]
ARLLSSLMIFILNAISSSKLTCVYPRLRCNEVKGHDNKRLFKRIRDKSFHLGIGGLGNFICNRMTIMVMTATVAIQNIAGVSFIINLSITILSISLILINNAMPELVRFRVEGAYDKLFNSFKRICF